MLAETVMNQQIKVAEADNFEEVFLNRELSWLEFNDRVLEEARDKENPLIERLRFLAITCSNLDEFFMVRVASLHNLINISHQKKDPANLSPSEQLSLVLKKNSSFVKKQYSCYNRLLLPALAKEGIELVEVASLNPKQQKKMEKYFEQTIFPVLSPLAVDSGRPFPLIANQSINLYLRFEEDGQSEDSSFSPFAIVQIPAVLPRIIEIKDADSKKFILLESIISHYIDRLFDNVLIKSIFAFRIMRNADIAIEEETASNLLSEIEFMLRQRQWGEVIRLEVDKSIDKASLKLLCELMEIAEDSVFKIKGPIDLKYLFQLGSLLQRPDLEYKPFKPQVSPSFYQAEDYFQVIRNQDVLLHHPFEQFDPVIKIIQDSAVDPAVLAIKQTLYRVSGNSPIIAALAKAAEAGKQVLVLVELKARFDEENNIFWARSLERAGCHVIYGLRGLKTHSKITLIVRQEEDGIRRYVHLGTGNYNDSTAKVYTDLGLWTSSASIGHDASNFFNMISGYSLPKHWKSLIVAPRDLRKETMFRIEQEAQHAKAGKKAIIVAKINSLVDSKIIKALYEASQAGVKIILIVRGICCLRPGVKGLSENIEVRSLIGRYLEHSRIFYYYNDQAEDVFLSSADWMPRNLDRRIELLFPIKDAKAKQRILDILQLQIEDTVRARIMLADGSYLRVDRRGKEIIDSQLESCKLAIKEAKLLDQSPAILDYYEPMKRGDK